MFVTDVLIARTMFKSLPPFRSVAYKNVPFTSRGVPADVSATKRFRVAGSFSDHTMPSSGPFVPGGPAARRYISAKKKAEQYVTDDGSRSIDDKEARWDAELCDKKWNVVGSLLAQGMTMEEINKNYDEGKEEWVMFETEETLTTLRLDLRPGEMDNLHKEIAKLTSDKFKSFDVELRVADAVCFGLFCEEFKKVASIPEKLTLYVNLCGLGREASEANHELVSNLHMRRTFAVLLEAVSNNLQYLYTTDFCWTPLMEPMTALLHLRIDVTCAQALANPDILSQFNDALGRLDVDFPLVEQVNVNGLCPVALCSFKSQMIGQHFLPNLKLVHVDCMPYNGMLNLGFTDASARGHLSQFVRNIQPLTANLTKLTKMNHDSPQRLIEIHFDSNDFRNCINAELQQALANTVMCDCLMAQAGENFRIFKGGHPITESYRPLGVRWVVHLNRHSLYCDSYLDVYNFGVCFVGVQDYIEFMDYEFNG